MWRARSSDAVRGRWALAGVRARPSLTRVAGAAPSIARTVALSAGLAFVGLTFPSVALANAAWAQPNPPASDPALDQLPPVVEAVAPTPPTAAAPSDDGPLAGLLAIVRDRAAKPEARRAAADALVAPVRPVPGGSRRLAPGAAEAMARALTELDEGGAGHFVLDAIAALPDAPTVLGPALARAAEAADDAALPRVLRAVGAVRSRASAGLLAGVLAPEQPEPVRRAAIEALARLSGREIEGPADAWRPAQVTPAEYAAALAAMDDAAFGAEVAGNLATRVERLAARGAALDDRLVEATRRLHLATPPAERSAMLGALLLDSEPRVRALGFELAQRELAAGARLNGEVVGASVRLLTHTDARVRARAAELLRRLAPEGVEEPVVAALAQERDAETAAALLSMAPRWPSRAVLDAVLAWMDLGAPNVENAGGAEQPGRDAHAAVNAAAGAAWALFRAGELREQADLDRALAALRATPPERLAPAGVHLLARLGSADDRPRLATLLGPDAAPEQRLAAGEALADDALFVDALLGAAADDPRLLDAALRAVLVHAPTVRGVLTLERITPAGYEARLPMLRTAARALPAAGVLEVASRAGLEPATREFYLAQLENPDRVLSERADPAQRRAIALGLLELARLRLASDKPDAALAALEALPELDSVLANDAPDATAGAPAGAPALGDEARALRATALLCLGRADQARELDAPAAAWIDALRRVKDTPQAPVLLREIRERFSQSLTPEQVAQLDALKISAVTSVTPEDGRAVASPSPRTE